MPAGYESMRDEFYKENLANGMDEKEALKAAKTKAAKIWNSKHPNNPVTKSHDDIPTTKQETIILAPDEDNIIL